MNAFVNYNKKKKKTFFDKIICRQIQIVIRQQRDLFSIIIKVPLSCTHDIMKKIGNIRKKKK